VSGIERELRLTRDDSRSAYNMFQWVPFEFHACDSQAKSEPGTRATVSQTEAPKSVWNPKEDGMSDPRFTDPRDSDPRLSDPVVRRSDSRGGMWGWIAGIAVLALIAFIIIGGWSNTGSNTASNPSPAPVTTGSAPSGSTTTPPSTTGSGTTSPQPPPPPAAR
jgi:hypothetical protein